MIYIIIYKDINILITVIFVTSKFNIYKNNIKKNENEKDSDFGGWHRRNHHG